MFNLATRDEVREVGKESHQEYWELKHQIYALERKINLLADAIGLSYVEHPATDGFEKKGGPERPMKGDL